MRAKRADGGVASRLLLFASTPQSNLRFASSPAGAPFGCGTSSNPKAVPVYGGFEPSAPSGRCSEGRIGRNREYCKRQRCKTTIFQPAFVAANVMSSRKGNGSKMPSYLTIPHQLRLRSAAPPQAVAPFGCPSTHKKEPPWGLFSLLTYFYLQP